MPPDPYAELRMTALQATRGANFWSRRPVTRMDIAVGAYEEISSADCDGFTERLVGAMPGLDQHRCSIGEPGGFITRLRNGTYAAHITEHVALELQTMVGHEVGFGKTRGGDVDGEYTLVFEHQHEAVGLRSAALALDVVQAAFAGTLDSVAHHVAELAAIGSAPDVPPARAEVLCAITGGDHRAETRAELARRCPDEAGVIVDVAPSYVLQAGLPFSRARMAIILDAAPTGVPARYTDRRRARQLVTVVADVVPRGGVVICPAKEWEVQDMVRDQRCRVAVFSDADDVTRRDKKVARAAAWPSNGRIVIEHRGELHDRGPLTDLSPVAAQVAAELAAYTIAESHGPDERAVPRDGAPTSAAATSPAPTPAALTSPAATVPDEGAARAAR